MASAPRTMPYCYTAGDQLPPLVGEIALDLTGYIVEFVLVRSDDTTIEKASNTSGITITDAVNGKFQIEWEASDLIAGVGQCGQVKFIDPSNKAITAPQFLLDVAEDKDPTP